MRLIDTEGVSVETNGVVSEARVTSKVSFFQLT